MNKTITKSAKLAPVVLAVLTNRINRRFGTTYTRGTISTARRGGSGNRMLIKAIREETVLMLREALKVAELEIGK